MKCLSCKHEDLCSTLGTPVKKPGMTAHVYVTLAMEKHVRQVSGAHRLAGFLSSRLNEKPFLKKQNGWGLRKIPNLDPWPSHAHSCTWVNTNAHGYTFRRASAPVCTWTYIHMPVHIHSHKHVHL